MSDNVMESKVMREEQLLIANYINSCSYLQQLASVAFSFSFTRKLVTKQSWKILQGYVRDNNWRADLDWENHRPLLKQFKFDKMIYMEGSNHYFEFDVKAVIVFFWYVSRKFGGLAIQEIYKEHSEKEKYHRYSEGEVVGSSWNGTVAISAGDKLIVKAINEIGLRKLSEYTTSYVMGCYTDINPVYYADLLAGFIVTERSSYFG